MPRSRFGLLLAVVFASSLAAAVTVSFDGQNLSVDLREAELNEALAAVTEETGVDFEVGAGVGGRLSKRFQDLPLDQALARLLSGYSHILIYGPEGDEQRVTRVLILPEGSQDTVFPAPEPELEPEFEPELEPYQEPPIVEEEPLLDEGDPALAQNARQAGSGKPAEVVLRRLPSGHYVHPGYINGKSVQFLVDTGATSVSISESMAQSLGLTRGSTRTVFTATGPTAGYQSTLNQVDVGELSLHDVDAIVLPGLNQSPQVLLGMSFLAQFELQQRGDTLIIREMR